MMKRRWVRHFFSVLGLVLASTAIAESAEEKGLAIAIEADLRDQGWIDSQVQMEMVLRNAKGNESKRRVRLKTLEVSDDGDKSLIAELRSTKLPIRAAAMRALGMFRDELYRPAVQRVISVYID